MTANDYGGQLYRYDRKSTKATSLSRDFDPAVQNVVWHAPSKRVVARVADRQYVRLATCNLDGEWDVYETGVDVVSGWEVARDAKTVVAYGTSADAPLKLFTFGL